MATELRSSGIQFGSCVMDVTGSAPSTPARVFVNFDGTGSGGTNQSIRQSLNVSSVYKNGTGNYTVNFSTALVDSNYSACGSKGRVGGDGQAIYHNATFASTYLQVTMNYAPDNSGNSLYDNNQITLVIFR